MSQDKKQIKDRFPLLAYNYNLSIGGSTLGCSEVSGLNLEYEPVTYKHGLSFWLGAKIIPGMRREPVKLTLKKAIFIAKENENDFLTKWLQDAYADPLQNPKQDILIDLCDELGNAVVRWKVRGALPTKLDAPTFDSNSNEVAFETLELVAHTIEVDFHPQ
jgi:phage tail-like protein